MVDADPRAQIARERAPEHRREPEPADRVGDLVAPGAVDDADGGERLCAFDGRGLREVHDVDRALAVLQERLDGLVRGRVDVVEVERDGALDARDLGDVAARALLEVVDDVGDVAEGRRHEQELGTRQLDERHLPRPPAIGVGVVVELVHDDLADVGVGAVTQREVREDLGGAAHDRGVRVDRGVTRDHADVLGTEGVDEVEEFLAHERLDGGRVVAPLPLRERDGVRGDRDERLAGARRGRQDDVAASGELHRGLVLRGVERDAPVASPLDERVVDGVRIVGVELLVGPDPGGPRRTAGEPEPFRQGRDLGRRRGRRAGGCV